MMSDASGSLDAESKPTPGVSQNTFADTRAAYEALDDATRARIADLQAYHSLYYSQGRAGYLPQKNEDGGYNGYGYHDGEPSLRPLVKGCLIDKTPRKNERPSDHAPVMAELDLL